MICPHLSMAQIDIARPFHMPPTWTRARFIWPLFGLGPSLATIWAPPKLILHVHGLSQSILIRCLHRLPLKNHSAPTWARLKLIWPYQGLAQIDTATSPDWPKWIWPIVGLAQIDTTHSGLGLN